MNPCLYQNPCARNAECIPINHGTTCRCPPELPRGDAYSYCLPLESRKPQPVCKIDSDCPPGLACLRERCLDPCKEIHPCDSSAVCRVINSEPFRTMSCTCPDGWVPNEYGQCRPILPPLPPPGCTSDSECSDVESCVNRACRSPCDCGQNSDCIVRNHRAICVCKTGYEGVNPNVACYPGKYPKRKENIEQL